MDCCGQFWRRKDGWSMKRSPEELKAAAGGGGKRRGGGREPGDNGRNVDATASNALPNSANEPLNINHHHHTIIIYTP